MLYPSGGLQPSKRRRCIIPRHANADSAHLPPAAATEATNLQNFFPFPRQEKEEKALEDDDVEEEERHDDHPAGFLDCCCWRGVVEKWSFFLLEAGLSLETAFLMASSCSTFNDFLTTFSKTSVGKSSKPDEILALQRSIKDSKDKVLYLSQDSIPTLENYIGPQC